MHDKIRLFIVENFLFDDDGNVLGDDDSLLEKGIIDSTGILEVVSWIEETFGYEVDDDELVPDNFDSINRLAQYIKRKTS